MSDDPIRLREDPRAASALRRDLSLAAKFSAVPAGFDAAAALARFDAARASASPSSTARAMRARTARWWGVGAIGLATLIALGAWGARALWTSLAAHPITEARGASTATHAGDDRGGREHPATPTLSPGRIEPSNANANALSHAVPHDTAVPNAATNTGANANNTATAPSSPLANAVTLNAPSTASAAPSRNARRTIGAGINPGDDLLARDARMLTDAYAALAVDPARALTLANSGEREFPASSHQDEREVIAVRALVALRRSGEAHARGERFLARSPSGTYAGAVRQALYEGPRDH